MQNDLSSPGVTQGSLAEAIGPVLATHAVVVSADTIRLVLTVGDEPAIGIVLGPADALALACDLLSAARPRFGR